MDDILLKLIDFHQEEVLELSKLMETISLDALSRLFHLILIHFFSRKEKDFVKLKKVLGYLNTLFIESVKFNIKNAGQNTSFVIHEKLMSIYNHRKVLDIFKIVDFRFQITFETLINIFKKLFFNNTAAIFCNIFDKLTDKEYLKINEEMSCNFYIDFFKEFNQFLEEFEYFKNFPGFFSIKIEFIRKVFYLFVNNFKFIIDQKVFSFEFSSLMMLLEGIIYVNKETMKLFSSSESLQENDELLKKVVINYKNIFFGLGENLMNKIRVIIDKQSKVKLDNIKLEDFNFEKILKNEFKDMFEILKKERLIYSKKVYIYLLIKLVEKFIQKVSEADSDWIEKNLKKEINKKKEFFKYIETARQKFDYFEKFLDLYLSYVLTSSEKKAQNILGMLPTILGEKLSEDTMYNIIKTRPGGFLNYKYFQMRSFYNSLIEHQNKGDIKTKSKYDKKKKVEYFFSILKFFTLVIIKVKKIKKKIKTNKKKKKETQKTDINQQYKQTEKLKFSSKMIFLKKLQFADMSSEEVFADVKKIITISPLFKYLFEFEEGDIIISDENSNLIKSFFCCKINKIEKNSYNNLFFLIITYRKNEKIVIISKKGDKINNCFDKLQIIVESIQKMDFNQTEILITDYKTSKKDSSFFFELLHNSNYILKLPSIIKKADKSYYKDYKTYGFLFDDEKPAFSQEKVPLENETKKPKKVVYRRKPINLFTDKNLEELRNMEIIEESNNFSVKKNLKSEEQIKKINIGLMRTQSLKGVSKLKLLSPMTVEEKDKSEDKNIIIKEMKIIQEETSRFNINDNNEKNDTSNISKLKVNRVRKKRGKKNMITITNDDINYY